MGADTGGDRSQRTRSPHVERSADGGRSRCVRGADPHLIDYHIHSVFSCDCDTGVQAICEAAIARGLREIAICDHAEYTPLDECYGYLRPGPYLAEIRRCQRMYAGRITVRAGVEIGEPHKVPAAVAELLDAHQFDFVLGSLHIVDGLPDFSTRHLFSDRTLEEGVGVYLGALADQAAAGDFDVLSHFDIIARAVFRAFGAPLLDYSPYENMIRHVLRILVDRGKGLEINTSTAYRGMGSLAPAGQVLGWYRELGGRIVTVGSDAHTVGDVGACCDDAIALAKAAGFDRLATFERREPRWVTI